MIKQLSQQAGGGGAVPAAPGQQPATIQTLLARVDVKKRFEDILGKKAPGFISSIISAVKANRALEEAEPGSVLSAAVIAATLDLPIQNNLGFAAIVPYRDKGKPVAQFQIMSKGFIQLAMRTGQYQTLNVAEVYDGELISRNRFTGAFLFDEGKRKPDAKVIGYVAYFKMVNGFEKSIYWTVEEITAHAKKYSKSYENKNGVWQTNYDAMARKTVIKNLLSKYGILSVDMQLQTALIADQALINDPETLDVRYLDRGKEDINPEELEVQYELNKELLTEEERTDAERILQNKEVSNYPKLVSLFSKYAVNPEPEDEEGGQ